MNELWLIVSRMGYGIGGYLKPKLAEAGLITSAIGVTQLVGLWADHPLSSMESCFVPLDSFGISQGSGSTRKREPRRVQFIAG